MSKDREPYRCDAPGCAKRRSNDANHWWLVRTGMEQNGISVIAIAPWIEAEADFASTSHACGIECMGKLVAIAAAKIVDAVRVSSSTGKDVQSGA
jgi:hypothetical protein